MTNLIVEPGEANHEGTLGYIFRDLPGEALAMSPLSVKVIQFRPIVDEVAASIESAREGRSADAALGFVEAALDTTGNIIDPIGSLVSAGLSILINELQPITAILDALTGDKAGVEANAATWHNIAQSLRDQADPLSQEVVRGREGWVGATAQRYTRDLQDADQLFTVLADAATLVADGTLSISALLEALRNLIIGVLSDTISFILMKAWENILPAVGTAIFISQCMVLIYRNVVKLLEFVNLYCDTNAELAREMEILNESLELAVREIVKITQAFAGVR
ncbi:hypothetical protein GCM10022198_19680 [Klugiella xanthotipulae]|uniref:Uncharacterized protein n=1 Tax=Klugiella xanthotipulae TaxID=244735 RepID=A0A543I6R2_9MICO|nr:hypothetical protein [Klugiella xanthotipulae]TQM66296.1 hypothetical protein FB466_1133 [Klugiella xanthotipulae]